MNKAGESDDSGFFCAKSFNLVALKLRNEASFCPTVDTGISLIC